MKRPTARGIPRFSPKIRGPRIAGERGVQYEVSAGKSGEDGAELICSECQAAGCNVTKTGGIKPALGSSSSPTVLGLENGDLWG